ncbi:acetyl-CoA carboxylase carboxyl transferase subunit beta [Actinomadura barringtoniae]|uniref:Multifunctional fusion protein n=1 Tax=Actinomadura barringtoniae TaxID=1427535 RepID=A0A939P5L2_9ACTN|nr:acetyl-CoA carboxylase carboxyltransferase subunit alpha/beta [Actinomadura barringtoniae]MBO2445580.1 acetyl-CoA carboxylase carboxyl transferase subunit beta [Actinomadura barringtoniae]
MGGNAVAADQEQNGHERTGHEQSDWLVCRGCRGLIYRRRFADSLSVCPSCAHHARLPAHARLEALLDPDSIRPLAAVPAPTPFDPLEFVDTVPYPERVAAARARTGLDEAVVCAEGRIEGHEVVVAVMDFDFFGGSLGSATGELITRAAEVSLARRVPFLVVTASGGARMQEGLFSLMQMAKTAQVFAELDEAGVLSVVLITDPTYAGVAASFASLGDVLIAEPGARMGFAGRRVIEQTIGERLPADFQTAEFLFGHGLIDAIGSRQQHRAMLGRLFSLRQDAVAAPEAVPGAIVTDPARLPEHEAWTAVQRARDLGRPTTLEYVSYLLDGFLELHGDRIGGDCPAIVGGIGHFAGMPIMLIGHQKGHSTADLLARNFGRATPEGHRKAARLMRMAAKLGLPIVTLIDTQGAEPGISAEENGQAIAIAESLRLMSGLPVPIVAVVTGEGGSGGALALGVADRVLALENAVYSIISPEGCAAILWHDASQGPRAAAALRVTSRELLRLGLVDGVVPEPQDGTQTDPALAAQYLRDAITSALSELVGRDPADLVNSRRARFRRIGSDAYL